MNVLTYLATCLRPFEKIRDTILEYFTATSTFLVRANHRIRRDAKQ
jgi:hypothetical protein